MKHTDLSALVIRRVIFHDVPVRNRLTPDATTTLSEADTSIDANRRAHLKTKLVKVLGSKSAYQVYFDLATPSIVPARVREFTTNPHNTADSFVAMSRAIAEHLFTIQVGSISAGLLCVLDATLHDKPALVLMKLEREEGARLELTEQAGTGKKTYSMAVLDNLVLTDGTRLFKTAIFVRTGPGDDDFDSVACDEQSNASAYQPMARFWLRFLGCQPALEPRVATQKFYESAVRFINDVVTDPVHKNDLYEHLHSELKSKTKTFSPDSFVSHYVDTEYRRQFREQLKSENLMSTFEKDLSDINVRLRRMALRTESGVIVTVPEDSADIVEVKPKRIIVNDQLVRVDR